MSFSVRKGVILNQNSFWDKINSFEIGFVQVVQNLLMVERTYWGWDKFAKAGGSKVASYAPLVLFSLGRVEQAKHLALSLVMYALLSTLGKKGIVRRRPGSYSTVYAPNCAVTSSFPSRHSICATVIGNFLPFKWIYISLLVLDRICVGNHFLSDCVIGVAIGEASVKLAHYISDPNLSLVLLLLSLYLWKGCAKIIGGCLPIIISTIKPSPISIILVPAKHFFILFASKYMDKENSFNMALIVLFATGLTVFLISVLTQILLSLQTTLHF